MDAVYRIKVGGQHEELRYSLRSLAVHLPVDRVWIVGFLPGWVKAEHIPQQRSRGTKYQRITDALALACQEPSVSDEFLLVDDDMFVLSPMQRMPTLHRGPLRAVGATYGGGRDVAGLLHAWGVREPLSYELHAPMVMSKTDVLDVIERAGGKAAGHARTLYGNAYAIRGEPMADVKVRELRRGFDGPFVSTTDVSFKSGLVGTMIRDLFPEPSPWES